MHPASSPFANMQSMRTRCLASVYNTTATTTTPRTFPPGKVKGTGYGIMSCRVVSNQVKSKSNPPQLKTRSSKKNPSTIRRPQSVFFTFINSLPSPSSTSLPLHSLPVTRPNLAFRISNHISVLSPPSFPAKMSSFKPLRNSL